MNSPGPILPGQKARPFLTPEQVRRLIDARKDGASFEDLARRFNVSRHMLSDLIKKGMS